MAITDVLKQLGMTLAGAGATGVQQGIEGLGAITNPLAYQQQQENLRQRQQLQQQLNLHMMINPFQQQQLDLEKQRMQNEADYRSKQLDTEQNHWQLQYNQATQQHENQLSEWQLANADKIQTAQPDEPGAVAIGGKFFKMKPASDTVDVGSDILGDLGLHLPDGATGVKMPIEKAGPILEQHRKLVQSRSMGAEADNLSGLIDQTFPPNDPQIPLLKSQVNAAKQQSDPVGMRSMLDKVYDNIKTWNQEYSPAALQRKQDIQRKGQVDAAKQEFELKNPYTPKEVVDGVEQVKSNGMRALKGMNPRLQAAVRAEAGKQGVNLFDLTTQEADNRAKANIALQTVNEIHQYLGTPEGQKALGIGTSRWNKFWTSKVGTAPSEPWQHIANKTKQAQSLLANIHYGVRGAANTEVQRAFNFANADKMDGPTFLAGLEDVESLLQKYAHEGETTPQSQLGLGGSQRVPLDQLLGNLPNKGGTK